MLLKSLDIQGFKTFPDKTTLKFEDNFVAVVGPNGSGKSNVSDAIRWVLGEQSTRILRCSKMEDVIFKGTTARKALGFAEVTLNIDNKDRELNFDSDNVSITRRYYRSGDSEYLINKATVRLKDINEMFMDTGLGRDGYSIIGQGKIDSIVAAKSEERREIFEEAAGISRYRYRKEESERRLNRTEENLIRLHDILLQLEERVEPLRIQSEKAEKFIAFDSEKKGLEIGIWVETLNRSGKILHEHEDKILIAESQHGEIETSLENLEKNIEENFRNTNLSTVKIDELRNEVSSADEEVLRVSGRISVLETNIDHQNQNILRVRSQIEEISSSEKNLDISITEKEVEIHIKDKQLDENNHHYIELAEKLEINRSSGDESSKNIENYLLSISNLTSKLSNQRISYSSWSSSVNEINNSKNSTDSLIKENQENKEKLLTEKEDIQNLINKNNEDLQNITNEIAGYEMLCNSKRKKAEEAKASLDKMTLDFNEETRRARMLEDLERNLEGFTHSVKVIMKESARGTLTGVHGPVTKILKTSKEYSTAIEIALGGAMQNIVVSTEQDAKTAINLLKRNNSGRGTFLPLTTIRGNVIDTRDIQNLEGFIGVASNLVTCDKLYDGIKTSILGRTAVVDSLNNAVIIAKKIGYKFRIVTLDGQVVNAGGSLTGGSANRNSGLLSRSSEIERIKEKAKTLQEKMKVLTEANINASMELASRENKITLSKLELQDIKDEQIKILSELTRVNRDIAMCDEREISLQDEKENSSSRVKALEEKMAESFDNITNLQLEVDQLEEKINLLKTSKNQIEEVTKEISTTLQEIKFNNLSLEKEKEALVESIENLKFRKDDSFGLSQRLNQEIKMAEDTITSYELDIKSLKEDSEKLSQISSIKKEEILTVSNNREALETASMELRQSEKELTTKRENISGELAKLVERKNNLQKEYDVIIGKLWEEYELTRREAEEQGIVIEDFTKSQKRLTELKSKIKSLGSVNVAAVVEYKEVYEKYKFLKEQIDDVEKSKCELLKLIGELTLQMKDQFATQFALINRNFQEIFKELFGGGTGSLNFTDETDILNSGIEIKVHPPGKIVSHIEALSGGEKALVAISIYFAIMKVSPPPFCMLDEVEAALDDVNVRRFADYLHRMNQNTQFILITHRRGTMEEADMIYGVTMQEDGISKILSLRSHEIDEKLKLDNN